MLKIEAMFVRKKEKNWLDWGQLNLALGQFGAADLSSYFLGQVWFWSFKSGSCNQYWYLVGLLLGGTVLISRTNYLSPKTNRSIEE